MNNLNFFNDQHKKNRNDFDFWFKTSATFLTITLIVLIFLQFYYYKKANNLKTMIKKISCDINAISNVEQKTIDLSWQKHEKIINSCQKSLEKFAAAFKDIIVCVPKECFIKKFDYKAKTGIKFSVQSENEEPLNRLINSATNWQWSDKLKITKIPYAQNNNKICCMDFTINV